MIKGMDSLGRVVVVAAMVLLLPVKLWQHAASAQNPGNTHGQANIHVLKSRVFYFPVRIDVANQARTKEVALYMRDGPVPGPWEPVATVPPTAEKIRCQVPHDGEFSFQVVLVDTQNRPSLTREDLDRLPPVMTVMVNTSPTPSETVYPLVQCHVDADPAMAQVMGGPPSRSVFEPPNFPASTFPASTFPARAQDATASPAIFNQVPKASQADSSSAPSSPIGQVSPIRLLNTTKVGIEYNVGRSGSSGVAKIDVWMTADNGRSWQRISEETNMHKPIQAQFPGEGIFGIRLVATNGTGVSGKAPGPGDLPSLAFEIDTSEPHIRSLETEPFFQNGTIDIRWKVTDKNIANEPISLFYAAQRSGPWQPIAVKVKNDGVYHWTMPRDMQPQTYFRLEAVDMAGNVGRVDTQVPILFDSTVPEIDVTGVQPLQKPQPPR